MEVFKSMALPCTFWLLLQCCILIHEPQFSRVPNLRSELPVSWRPGSAPSCGGSTSDPQAGWPRVSLHSLPTRGSHRGIVGFCLRSRVEG